MISSFGQFPHYVQWVFPQVSYILLVNLTASDTELLRITCPFGPWKALADIPHNVLEGTWWLWMIFLCIIYH